MRIGTLAERAGLSAKTIRYYEQTGLIRQPRRQGNGYRTYSERDVEILRFVHQARLLGFSVADVASLLDLWGDRDRASADVKRLAERHVANVERRIADLQCIRDTLKHLIGCCHGDQRPDCPILDSLAEIPFTQR